MPVAPPDLANMRPVVAQQSAAMYAFAVAETDDFVPQLTPAELPLVVSLDTLAEPPTYGAC